jgi:hypothetical protein
MTGAEYNRLHRGLCGWTRTTNGEYRRGHATAQHPSSLVTGDTQMHTRNHPRSALRAIITATLAAAVVGLPASAIAQTAKEQELEKRVAELEKMVQQLAAEKQAAPAPAAPAKPAAPAIQAGSITPNAAPNTTFVLTGFVKADALFTDTEYGDVPAGSGRDFYVPGTIPVETAGRAEDMDFHAHVKQSRVNFGTDTILDGGSKLSTRFEVDFFGSITGTERVSNTYAPVLRHAYVQWGSWLVGQTWSNFMDVATLPEAVDFIGTTDGTTFVRQPQLRFTKGGFSLSLENPETSITTLSATGLGNVTADDSGVPDVTARYAFKGSWGHVALAGLLRELKYQSGAVDESTWTGALSLSGKFNIGKDDIRWMLLNGNLGRYVALNFANDASLDLTGNGDLESIDGYAGFIAYRHMWTPKLRSTFTYAMQEHDNDSSLSSTATNESSSSWTVNLFYSPLPKLDIGAEYRQATRELENGVEGDLDRFQLTTKYSF